MLLKKCLLLVFVLITPLKVTAFGPDSGNALLNRQQTDAHPSLYITADKIKFIKTRLNQYPYSKFWAIVKEKAEQYSTEATPPSITQLHDGAIREFGDRIPFMALAYLITEDDKYLIGTRRWMNALSSYKDWASNTDLGAAHLLFSMSVAYDWLYDKWTTEERSRFSNKIFKHANILHQTLKKGSTWWTRREYLMQNHNYTNVMSIAVAGIALQNETPDTNEWIIDAEQNFQKVLQLLSPDGASHEGVGYWGYGIESLLKYYLANPKIDRSHIIKNSSFFQNTARFRLYASLPGYVDNVDYADSPRFDWNGPGYSLRALASIFSDGHAQWLAERIEIARGVIPHHSWLNLLWYDESVTPIPPDNLPIFSFFDNLGIFISRSDWTDDATWVFFKAGPSQGKLAESKDIYTGSHIHPDAGNFLVWAKGNWLVVDDGNVYKKRTENHNVLLFNEIGQLGEGEKWFNLKPAKEYAATSKFTHLDLQTKYQYLAAEIGCMYPPEAGVKTWTRSFIWLPPDNLIIHDDIVLSKPGHVEGKVHLSVTPRALTSNIACLAVGKYAGLVINNISHENNHIKLGTYEIISSERARHTNKSGGLIGLLSNDNNAQTLLININQEGCASKIYNNFLSTDDGRLIVRNTNTDIDINFKTKTVLFQDK